VTPSPIHFNANLAPLRRWPIQSRSLRLSGERISPIAAAAIPATAPVRISMTQSLDYPLTQSSISFVSRIFHVTPFDPKIYKFNFPQTLDSKRSHLKTPGEGVSQHSSISTGVCERRATYDVRRMTQKLNFKENN